MRSSEFAHEFLLAGLDFHETFLKFLLKFSFNLDLHYLSSRLWHLLDLNFRRWRVLLFLNFKVLSFGLLTVQGVQDLLEKSNLLLFVSIDLGGVLKGLFELKSKLL
jgi:hypothetical protein